MLYGLVIFSLQDEDRYFIADALQQVMEHMEDSLRAFGMAWMRKRGIDASTWNGDDMAVGHDTRIPSG